MTLSSVLSDAAAVLRVGGGGVEAVEVSQDATTEAARMTTAEWDSAWRANRFNRTYTP